MAGKEEQFKGGEKQRDVRTANILAARAVANAVRTSLGPKGQDKLITGSDGEVVISNDGATILQRMEVQHPAAKMLVQVSQSQDAEAGDGTTSVVVLSGALLSTAHMLLGKGIHPAVISDAFLQASDMSADILREVSIPVDLSDRESLIQNAVTSLSSKVVSDHSGVLAPLAVDAVLKIVNSSKGATDADEKVSTVDLNDIRVVKKLGGTIEDSELVDGLVFDQRATHAAGGPTRIEGAKIGLIQFCISAPKSDMDSNVVVTDFVQIDRVLKDERKYVMKIVKKVVKAGCNVLLIQKSILRDAVNDLALHYLAKKGVLVIKDIERSDIEFISKSLACRPVADVESFTSDKLGEAKLVEELNTPGGKIVKVTGIKNQGNTVSVLVRGSNRLVIDEAERSIHDALCVVRCLVKERNLIVGGGAPETEVSVKLAKAADETGGLKGYCMRKFAESLEIIPYTLAENAGLHPIKMVTELRKRHADGEVFAGINVRKGRVANLREENVVQPLLVSLSALKLATEVTRMILKIDDIVGVH